MADKDLTKLLELAENITRYRGFIGQRDQEDIDRNSAKFTKLRRAFIHRYAKREGSVGLHRAQLEAALRRVAADEGVPDSAFDFTRTELFDHLGKEHQRIPAARLLARWGPPIAAVLLPLIWHFLPRWFELKWLFP